MASGTELAQQLETVRDYIRWAVSQFNHNGIHLGHGTDNTLDEALHLILPSLGIPLGDERFLLDAKLTLAERELLLEKIDARVNQRIPVPYLTGQAWFAGLPFTVDQRVLIPRSPFAELIETGFEPWLAGQPVSRVLDLCTGSGCIGIACAHYFEEAQIDLADLSAAALEVAELNVECYELGHRLRLLHSDLFAAIEPAQYDVIVSNPPYVDAEDLANMPEEFQHEPAMGLGSGTDGLDITRRILAEAADYLSEQGLLFVEVGNSGHALQQAFPELPFTWLEFERGGHGVFVLSKQELEQQRFHLTDNAR